MYVRADRFKAAVNQYHFFMEGQAPYTLNPGYMVYECVAGLTGVIDYFDSLYSHHRGPPENSLRARAAQVYELFAAHEEALSARFLDFINAEPKVHLFGKTTPGQHERIPLFTFTVEGARPIEVADTALEFKVACRQHDHFYTPRLLQALKIDETEGAVRVSMVHYNTLEEVDRLIAAVERMI